jgi:predicted RNase H-like nuclease (RuvC/YqgF family)
MVNTRSEGNRVPREEGNSNDPQLTRLNEKMEQMAKSIEDLATMNAILQARVPEHHRTVTDLENREACNSHIRERREEERPEGSRVEGSRKRNGRKEEIPKNLPPPQTDALVLSLAIANHKIHRILIDIGSSADILYRSAFEQMKIDLNKVIPAKHLLVGFTGEQVLPLGSIELSVMAGTYPR